MSDPKPPKVFISYSHDSQEHRVRVYHLLSKLRADGVHCVTDHLIISPPEGWRAWMENQISEADFTLVVCTETYRRRAERKEKPGVGLGATWEASLITDEIYRNATRNEKFIPVVFAQEDIAHIPPQLGQVTFYRVDLDEQYENLLRHLTNQPFFEEPPVAERVRELPPKIRAQVSSPPTVENQPAQAQTEPISSTEGVSRHENFVENLGGGVTLDMIAIPGGSFLMGAEDSERTKPVHRVKLSPFHLGKYPVTQAQWKAVMGDNPSHFKGDKRPVEMISWEMAVEFCQKLTKKTGRQYRLPTEAEWEYACLAGSTGKYGFGDDDALLEKYAWYWDNSGNETHPVGEKLPNNWGLYDMHGNVWEWCQDWYDANYYAELSKQGEAVDPQGPASGTSRVLRGGSWGNSQLFARAVYRFTNLPADRDLNIGFRVVLCRPPSS
ncbi:MAG: SUMF1/EgtB/PvdO family nonheme iron enzyme [Acidobacteria bacterium]|nr:SUMF1/EgtB/PvdO family nonheme iron enzyme [Acidobacteriota bacterium]